jgi:ABC-type transporter Mla maintaining outer membrane lipid asymmetry ATPase subunit MlaF
VRRFAAILMLVLFTSLNAIDGICCPDGCTHEQDGSSTRDNWPVSDGLCVLCLGGVSSSLPDDLSVGMRDVSAVAAAVVTNPADFQPDPPEHPPRA